MVPFAYASALAIIFNLDMSDEYVLEDPEDGLWKVQPGQPMFHAFGPTAMTTVGVMRSLVPVLLALALLIAALTHRVLSHANARAKRPHEAAGEPGRTSASANGSPGQNRSPIGHRGPAGPEPRPAQVRI